MQILDLETLVLVNYDLGFVSSLQAGSLVLVIFFRPEDALQIEAKKSHWTL